MKLSLYVAENRDLGRCLEAIVSAERHGLHCAWLPGTLGIDPLIALALATTRTDRILLGAGIVHIWPRHPVPLAQQALTIQAAARGRFRLGVGIGHRPMVERAFGLEWDDPVARVHEFASVLGDLVGGGQVDFEGRHYRVHAAIGAEPEHRVPVLLAALGPRMCEAGGATADAVFTWLAPPSYLQSVVIPAVAAGAERAGRPAPPVIAGIPAALSEDRDEARHGMREAFGYQVRAPSYARMLEQAGVEEASTLIEAGWTDGAIDAVAAYGDDAALRDRARDLLDAGADEVVYWPFPVGADPQGSLAASVEAFGRIASAKR